MEEVMIFPSSTTTSLMVLEPMSIPAVRTLTLYHFEESFDAGFQLPHILHAIIRFDFENRNTFLLKSLFDLVGLHRIRRTELNAVMDHPVRLRILGEVENMFCPF